MNPKAFQCRTCEFKFYLNAASAGIALIFNPSNQLLVTRRKHDPFRGSLDLPGGFAEPGETMEECLIREVREELNIELVHLSYFASFPNAYLYKEVEYPITDFVFLCTAGTFATLTANDDVSDYYFKDLDQIEISRFGLSSPKRAIEQLKKGQPCQNPGTL